jgi:Ni/Fe-hydrogenase subunit HybB-like protein
MSAPVTAHVAGLTLTRPFTRGWLLALGGTFALVMVLAWAIAVLFARGVGVWGVQIPVAWGFAITNFVWWIGIGHAGTLISAILVLARQRWRTSVSRLAETMTLFAVACAALFPVLHLGRPQYFYWLIPYPSTMGVWPQFRSPLVWDFFAVSTYAIVSLLFWYTSLLPDLATLRDRAPTRPQRVLYGLLALGWRGSAAAWRRFEDASLLLAALATPLVVSVHSVVSLDFAVGIVPGWHATIFPPYFVAGALFSGFAMALTLVIPLRRVFALQPWITDRHLDIMSQLMLASGLIVAYGYAMEGFLGWLGGDPFERGMLFDRLHGAYAAATIVTLLCNVALPQLLWRSVPALFALGLAVNLGMWLERFVIVVQSLSHGFVPSAWRRFTPTVWDWATLAGSLGLFVFLMVVFVRVLPMLSMHELRAQRDAGAPA